MTIGVFRERNYRVIFNGGVSLMPTNRCDVDSNITFAAVSSLVTDDKANSYFVIEARFKENKYRHIKYKGKLNCADYTKLVGKKMSQDDKNILDLAVLVYLNNNKFKKMCITDNNANFNTLEEDL